jgi:aspartyl-tRNA synthetase
MLRTHTCGELRKKHEGKKVKLAGWVHTLRQYNKVAFLDIRDRYGLTQIVFNPKNIKEDLKDESVIIVEGEVVKRGEGFVNKKIDTGDVEVKADSIKVIHKTESLPFEVNKDKEVGDELRLKYRYLDLRKPVNRDKLIFRAKVVSAVRAFLDNENFIEIETPMLVKETPEGARDYIVPSRVNNGKFYALPQSPQLYKQILMIAGFDRYYQIARCLRDEDLRQDRQPEHTQIDLEMSFVDEQDIMDLVERLYKHLFKEILGVKLEKFEVLSYKDSMKKYKTDKPDLSNSKNKFAFCWVKDFPLFAYNKDDKSWEPEHHMFSMPKNEHVKYLDGDDLGKIEGQLFDLVLNGVELGSGSIRVSNPKLQEKIMNVIGMSKEEAKEKFGFLLDAYEYGGPIHGGMGLGVDRLVALMQGLNDIREVIAFPKNKAAECPMDGCPSEVSEKQLKELGLKVEKEK